MRSLKLLTIIFIQLCVSSSVIAQVSRSSFLKAGTLQVKESANFGLVFTGPSIDYGMAWNIQNDKRLITYEYEVGLGILLSRDIPALGFYLKPVDLAYLFKIPMGENRLFVGPSFKLEYNYHLYPDLQAGFDYWFTNLSLGINALYDFNYLNSSFHIRLNSSLAGISSRQEYYRDPYFYDIGFKHAINHLNNGFSSGSVNRFASVNLEALWRPSASGRFAFGYVMAYSGYYKQPEITIVSHSFKLVINKKFRK
jgi:hypothetical protein